MHALFSYYNPSFLKPLPNPLFSVHLPLKLYILKRPLSPVSQFLPFLYRFAGWHYAQLPSFALSYRASSPSSFSFIFTAPGPLICRFKGHTQDGHRKMVKRKTPEEKARRACENEFNDDDDDIDDSLVLKEILPYTVTAIGRRSYVSARGGRKSIGYSRLSRPFTISTFISDIPAIIQKAKKL
jgi:hypothetical protein